MKLQERVTRNWSLIAAVVLATLIGGVAKAEPGHMFSVGDRAPLDMDASLPNTRMRGWYGCRSYEDYVRFDHLIKVDGEAAFKFAERKCALIPNGKLLTVEDTAHWANFWNRVPMAVCARPEGEIDCLWIEDYMLGYRLHE